MPILTNKVRQSLSTEAGKYVCKQAYDGAKKELQRLSEYEDLYSDPKELEKALDKRVKNAFVASYKDRWARGVIDTFIKQAKSKKLHANTEEE